MHARTRARACARTHARMHTCARTHTHTQNTHAHARTRTHTQGSIRPCVCQDTEVIFDMFDKIVRGEPEVLHERLDLKQPLLKVARARVHAHTHTHTHTHTRRQTHTHTHRTLSVRLSSSAREVSPLARSPRTSPCDAPALHILSPLPSPATTRCTHSCTAFAERAALKWRSRLAGRRVRLLRLASNQGSEGGGRADCADQPQHRDDPDLGGAG
jgi:hypothetical protein